MRWKLSNQAGSGFGAEADADPVRARADVNAGRVRMLHGQSFDMGGFLLPKGIAFKLGPGLATVVGFALGLSLSGLAAGSRGRTLPSGRRCRHGRTPRERNTEGHARGSVRGRWQGKITDHCCKREPRDPGTSHRLGVTSDEAEDAPRLRVPYGEDSKESAPPLKRRVETHTASIQNSAAPGSRAMAFSRSENKGVPSPAGWRIEARTIIGEALREPAAETVMGRADSRQRWGGCRAGP
jgi:hypothetical protein